MMELAGLAIGTISLAGLFSTCIQCFDMIQLGQAQDRDFEILHTKLDNQKVRFMIWGQALGLDGSSSTSTAFDRAEIRHSLVRSMKCIIGIFDESQQLMTRYGIRQQSTDHSIAARTGNNASALKETFRRFQARLGSSKPRSAVRWVIIDRKKFLALVQDLRELIDDLESLTRSADFIARQRVIVSYEIESISDVASLELVEAAATGSQDLLSSAASSRRERLSLRQPTLATASSEGEATLDSFYTAPTSIAQVSSMPDQPKDLGLHHLSLAPQNQRLINSLPKTARAQPTGDPLKDTGRSTSQQNDKFTARARSDRLSRTAVLSRTPLKASRHTLRRLLKELSDLNKYDPALVNFTCAPINYDVCNLLATIHGFPDSPYAGGIFYLRITIPPDSDYPFRPPRMWFITRIFHPNIDARGRICWDLFEGQWSPALTIANLLSGITSLMSSPNAEDPLVPEIAQQYITDRALYDENARKYTQRYATGEHPPPNQLTDEPPPLLQNQLIDEPSPIFRWLDL